MSSGLTTRESDLPSDYLNLLPSEASELRIDILECLTWLAATSIPYQARPVSSGLTTRESDSASGYLHPLPS